MVVVAMFTCMTVVSARFGGASPVVGTLANFDVVNDTGSPTHGFEIEVEGVDREDVSFTFGGPYSRYGDPELIVEPGAISKVVVQYRNRDGFAWVSTPPAGEPVRPWGT